MSSTTRATSKGGKGSKVDKSHKSDKSDSGKGSGDKQQNHKDNSKLEDPSIKEKVRTLMEMIDRSEEEVCYALHECDNDVNLAINLLLEKANNGEWETTTVKKKKNRQSSTSKKEKTEESAPPVDEWNDNGGQQQGGGGNGTDKEKSRNKSGGPPRLHGRHNDNRSWRGREKQENDRNLDDGGNNRSDFHRDRRGRSGGSTRGGGGGRGRGGGRAGGRYPPRGRNNTNYKPIDTWDNSNNTWDNSTAVAANHNPIEDNWDDFPGTDEWSTEEYTGSLADTKVFTPSVPPKIELETTELQSTTTVSDNLGSAQLTSSLQITQQTVQISSQSPVSMVGTLNSAQTQYFNQLQQQNSDNMKQYGSSQTYQNQSYDKTSPQVYNASTPAGQPYNNAQHYSNPPSNTYVNSNYTGVNNNYVNTQDQQPTQQQQPARTKTQRARLPPPSKIPASAVEMPGDLNSSIGYLDVQFGAMDFMSDSGSFEGVADSKYNSTSSAPVENSSNTGAGSMDLSAASQNATIDTYSPKPNTQQSSISSALSQSLTSTDSIPQTSEHMTNAYSSSSRNTTTGSAATSVAAAPPALDLNKQQESHTYSQSSTYNSYPSKTNSYNASSYSGSQTTSSSYVSNQSSNSYVNSQSGSYNPPSANTYQNAYSSTTSYQNNSNTAAYPSMTQANSYPATNQSYPANASQSVYGANTGLNSSSNFGNTSTSQYNSYSSSASNHKLVKDSTYDNSSSTVSTAQTTASSNVASSTTLSLSQTTSTGSKTTTTLAAKNSNNVISNIPPGVTPVMSTPYILGQMPYFQQPVYSYEDMQLLQQRLPHMTTPFYDMSYQTPPTTLAAVRDATLGNVGYSISDGRFTRGDNNASPVPSTLSQQTSTLTQGHQAQPILAGTAPQYFFAPTAFNTLPNYQFGTMYTQLPAVTNAHGTSNSNQYPKPATYGSGYGTYDALSQTQDYTKGGYVSNTQGQKGAGGNASAAGTAGNDLSAMYGKSHAALGKVNSYEKQGFHSGTPPPFTGALHGSQNAGLAPSGTGYAPQVYIPTMAPHQQHHSTQLMHQPLHQDSGSGNTQRSQASNQAKAGAKQPYPTYSSWNQA